MFRDILADRRHSSDVNWATRPWHPTSAYNLPYSGNPFFIKQTVLHSRRLIQVMRQISDEEDLPVETIKKRVLEFLEEICYSREMPVIRWASLFTLKILKRVCRAVFVNEDAILKMKLEFGRTPVVFIPSHRSYADFILTSFTCFAYDLELPRIAAGMDFQNMAVMGQMLRDCCAFFMRRTFSDNKLYSATFSEFVQALVTHGAAPLEFFIEGTRSRTGKALVPKFGLLSMILKPFLTGLVHDISVVPVNISYERIMEEVLYAYELLGVPKPKESTKGFIKALSILKEDYGETYVNFGEPVSVREYMHEKLDQTAHTYGPVELQDLTPAESKQIVGFAYHIIIKQQSLQILNCSNVLCCALTNYMLSERKVCTLTRLADDVRWLAQVLAVLGASLRLFDDVRDCIRKSICWHHSLLSLHGEEVHLRYFLAHGPQGSGAKNRGANLSSTTMDSAIPFLVLQSYVNPAMHYFTNCAAIVLALKTATTKNVSRRILFKEYLFFRKVFAHEFVYYRETEQRDFENTLANLIALKVTAIEGDFVRLDQNYKLVAFLVNTLAAFLPGYVALVETLLTNAASVLSESVLLKSTQETIEKRLIDGIIAHPGNLSLDILTNGLHSIANMGAIGKTRSNGGIEYSVSRIAVERIFHKLGLWEKEISRTNLHQLTATMGCKL